MGADGMDPHESAEVIVRCQYDRSASVRFSNPHAPDPYRVEFSLDLCADGFNVHLDRVAQLVWGRPLTEFLDELVADFRGWEGERTWSVDQFAVTATFHSGGHVALQWQLRSWASMDAGWHASVTTLLEAGEQLRNLAADLREFLDFPYQT